VGHQEKNKELDIKENSMKKKILVRGPALSQTGYGEQCRFALRALRTREDVFDVYLLNIPWGGTNWIFEDNEERKWLDSLINKATPLLQQQAQNPQVPLFDISLQVTIPNELQRMAPQNILYTAGIETNKVSPVWLQKCHELADKILVISEHAKKGFQVPIKAQDQAGNPIDFTLEKPIEVVHYPVKKIETKDLELELETDFNFLTIAQFGPRKNLPDTIAWFCQEFHNESDVGLIVKTFGKGNSRTDKQFSEGALKQVLENFPERKCKVYFLHGYMTEQEIHSLYVHPKIKAMINFGHGEGFGLPLFEAAYSGLPVITHEFGGQADFLYAPKKNKKGKEKLRAHFSKVNWDLKAVQKEAHWGGVIEPDQQWAYPNANSCKVAMREAVKNYGMLQGEAKRLKKWLVKEFEESRKYEQYTKAIYDPSAEELEWANALEEVTLQ
jgi:glycosyltransferase involved in cell wall biosynthesis